MQDEQHQPIEYGVIEDHAWYDSLVASEYGRWRSGLSPKNQGGIFVKAISGLSNILSVTGTSQRNKMGPGGVGIM